MDAYHIGVQFMECIILGMFANLLQQFSAFCNNLICPVLRQRIGNHESAFLFRMLSISLENIGTVKRDNPYHYGEKKHRPGVSMEMITYLVNTSKYIKNSRLAMFRISKYSSMKGISYLSGE